MGKWETVIQVLKLVFGLYAIYLLHLIAYAK